MGFSAGNTTSTVILRAVLVMIISWIAGQAIGAVAQRTIEIQIDDYVNAHPFPKLSSRDRAAGEEDLAAAHDESGPEASQPSPET